MSDKSKKRKRSADVEKDVDDIDTQPTKKSKKSSQVEDEEGGDSQALHNFVPEVSDEDADSEELDEPDEGPVRIKNDDDAMSEQQEEDLAELLNDKSVEEEEPSGEDIMDDDLLEKDYEEKPELDHYDPELLDDTQYVPMSLAERIRAERDLEHRDELEGRNSRNSRLPAALFSDSDMDDDEDTQQKFPRRRVAFEDTQQTALDEEDDEDEEPINLEDKKGPLREWIVLDGPRREIARRYRNFLRTYVDEHGHNVYIERIKTMCATNKESLILSWVQLAEQVPVLAAWVADAPSEMLPILDEVTMLEVKLLFPEYQQIHPEVHVRIADLPVVDSIRDIRQVHLNCLIRVGGVVTRRTGVFPQLKYLKYNCGVCQIVLGPYYQENDTMEIKPTSCPECQSKGPFSLNTEQTVYRNYQKITLQESPGTIPPGRLPRSKDVILLHDLIDNVKPGDEVEITGIYRNSFDRILNSQHGFPVFKTVIEANHVFKKDDILEGFRLTEEDEHVIRKLAKDENIGEKIIQSMAPSIYGHHDIKTAIALSLFGGEAKEINKKHKIRGDINVLIMGDPGTAKSQFLKYIEKTAHRAVYTTGQGASAVGLTAAVRKDAITREWTLEGGALVLADRGVCMIDEFDKMNDKDRTSIHEAMEQQSISISKAGIVTTLQARASVIAAANPIKGRYDSSLSFAQNVDLTEPILSRFDILCVVRDLVDPVLDERLADFVLQSHTRSHPDYIQSENEEAYKSTEGPIPQEILRKYILYAKTRCHPRLTRIDRDKISKLYAELRRESMTNGSIPMTVRHVESIIRMTEAHAKMHLREYCTADDVNMAIRVMLNSFINSQKFSISRSLRNTFRKYITYKRDHIELCHHFLLILVNETVRYHQARDKGQLPATIEIDCEEFESRMREHDITDLKPFYTSSLFASHKFTYDARKRVILKAF
jgi:DNA replication licensing factor MCM2